MSGHGPPKCDRPKAGERGHCSMCGRPVVFAGVYWTHTDGAFRHPANPAPVKGN